MSEPTLEEQVIFLVTKFSPVKYSLLSWKLGGRRHDKDADIWHILYAWRDRGGIKIYEGCSDAKIVITKL